MFVMITVHNVITPSCKPLGFPGNFEGVFDRQTAVFRCDRGIAFDFDVVVSSTESKREEENGK